MTSEPRPTTPRWIRPSSWRRRNTDSGRVQVAVPAAQGVAAGIEAANDHWAAGRRSESTEALRKVLAEGGAEAWLHYMYGARLLESGRADAAFEALKCCLDRSPTHLDALELAIEIARTRFPGEGHESRMLAALAESAPTRPEIQRDSLAYLIPFRRGTHVASLSDAGDRITRGVVDLHLRREVGGVDLTREERRLAEAIYALGRGQAHLAAKLLGDVPEESLPVDSIRRAARRTLASGNNRGARLLLEQYRRRRPEDAWAREKHREVTINRVSDTELGERGFTLPPRPILTPPEARSNGVLYVAYNSLPYHSAGYATRTQGLLTALGRSDWAPRVLTRLGYPYDMPGYETTASVAEQERVGDVTYHRMHTERTVVPRKPLHPYLVRYADGIADVARREDTGIVHAASNYVNGLAGALAARRLGLPFVYEVRGLWEVTRASRDPSWVASDEHELMVRLETQAACAADRVIAITRALADELERRGVPPETIDVVPNGVDVSAFSPLPRDPELERAQGLVGRTVIGYVGSLLDYEGLDLLLRAAAALRAHRHDFAVLIVGDGPARPGLENLRDQLGLGGTVVFPGRVPHEEVERYYSLIDIAPFPRTPIPVCEMVSPIKPFEAMAMEKAVVVSSVAALAEIVQDGVTGRVHGKGDVESLARVLNELLDSPEHRSALGRQARRWVATERSWARLASKVTAVYGSLGRPV